MIVRYQLAELVPAAIPSPLADLRSIQGVRDRGLSRTTRPRKVFQQGQDETPSPVKLGPDLLLAVLWYDSRNGRHLGLLLRCSSRRVEAAFSECSVNKSTYPEFGCHVVESSISVVEGAKSDSGAAIDP